MMILPLADALQNCLQNLTSRIAGVDNEQMTGRVMGMGAMLGFGLGAIKEQFKTPDISNNANNSNNSGGGLKGFVSRAKSVINPSMNLSAEKDYDGNVNPIRTVIKKQNDNKSMTPMSNIERKTEVNEGSNINTPKSVLGKVARVGVDATRAYLEMGANLVEGDFDKSNYRRKNINRRNKFNSTEYVNNINDRNTIKKSGDKNEPEE